jgi:hypothetical protein
VLDGTDYFGTYSIMTSRNVLNLWFITTSSQQFVGMRVFLTTNNTSYQVFKVPNQEFSFDVDVLSLPCGLNSALYLTEMDADISTSPIPTPMIQSTTMRQPQHAHTPCHQPRPALVQFLHHSHPGGSRHGNPNQHADVPDDHALGHHDAH